jgi:hypothetical protein
LAKISCLHRTVDFPSGVGKVEKIVKYKTKSGVVRLLSALASFRTIRFLIDYTRSIPI